MTSQLASAAEIVVYFDAATRVSNPGPSGIAVAMRSTDQKPLYASALLVGKRTNNEAEWTALIRSLKILVYHATSLREVWIRSDSKLVVMQALGEWRVRGNLQEFHARGQELAQQLVDRGVAVHIEHVPRSQNAYADMLVTDLMNLWTGRKRGY